jgi:hypothetical protein
MTDDVLQCDPRSEISKGAVHLVVDLSASVCFAYSICANVLRPTPRLKLQMLFYLVVVGVESYQVFDHWHKS